MSVTRVHLLLDKFEYYPNKDSNKCRRLSFYLPHSLRRWIQAGRNTYMRRCQLRGSLRHWGRAALHRDPPAVRRSCPDSPADRRTQSRPGAGGTRRHSGRAARSSRSHSAPPGRAQPKNRAEIFKRFIQKGGRIQVRFSPKYIKCGIFEWMKKGVVGTWRYGDLIKTKGLKPVVYSCFTPYYPPLLNIPLPLLPGLVSVLLTNRNKGASEPKNWVELGKLKFSKFRSTVHYYYPLLPLFKV